MGPGRTAIAAVTVALAGGHSHGDEPRRAAIPELSRTPTSSSARLEPSRAIPLTIGMGGDLLPHLPIVARAHMLAGGHGYDFRPLLQPIRRWVRSNSLSFCHSKLR